MKKLASPQSGCLQVQICFLLPVQGRYLSYQQYSYLITGCRDTKYSKSVAVLLCILSSAEFESAPSDQQQTVSPLRAAIAGNSLWHQDKVLMQAKQKWMIKLGIICYILQGSTEGMWYIKSFNTKSFLLDFHMCFAHLDLENYIKFH